MRSKDILKVRLRGGFSDRNKIKTENVEMQYSDLDGRTRIAIINLLDTIFGALSERLTHNAMQFLLVDLLRDVYCQEISSGESYDKKKILGVVKETIKSDDYDSVLTVIEYCVKKVYRVTNQDMNAEIYFNGIFEKEYVGYRFVNQIITPITDENEISAINEAYIVPYKMVREHLNKALLLLSDREKADYENSIKESISAVEAICEHITGITGKEATLGKLLKKLEDKGVVIHSAMKSAFNSLYGYSSDANGIRHAGDIGGPASTFEEAKFMLVSCSAFINYLISVEADK